MARLAWLVKQFSEDDHPRDHGRFASKPGGKGESDDDKTDADQTDDEKTDSKARGWEPENYLDPKYFDMDHWDSDEQRDKAKAITEKRWEVRNMIRDHLDSADLPDASKTEYLDISELILLRMPTAALQHLLNNVKKIEFYPDTQALNAKLNKTSQGTIGGCWQFDREDNSGTIHLDGNGGMDVHTSGIYAHEFGHVCDWIPGNRKEEEFFKAKGNPDEVRQALEDRMRQAGFSENDMEIYEETLNSMLKTRFTKNSFDHLGIDYSDLIEASGTEMTGTPGRFISKSALWKEAFDEELSQGQLSKYGATSLGEGFAEFARLVWGGGEYLDAIAKDFPKCWAVFQKHGLVRL